MDLPKLPTLAPDDVQSFFLPLFRAFAARNYRVMPLPTGQGLVIKR